MLLGLKLNLETDVQLKNQFETEYKFRWDVGNDILYWYRVESECLSFGCQETGLDPNDLKCGAPPPDGVRQLTIVAARGLADLCTKLKERSNQRPWNVRIRSIKKLSRPVRTTDFELVTGVPAGSSGPDLPEGQFFDTSDGSGRTGAGPLAPGVCQELTEEEFREVEECLEFSLDVDAFVHMGIFNESTLSFFSHEVSGGISFGGSAEALGANQILGTGLISIFGSADSIVDSYDIIGSILVDISGAADVTSPFLSYDASGGLTFSGQVGVISQNYDYIASGGITFGGTVEGLLDYVTFGSGLIKFGGQVDAFLDFVIGGGLITFSGFHEVEIPDRFAEGSGLINVLGASNFVFPAWNYHGIGGITLSSSTGFGLPVYEGSGLISIGGSAETDFGLGYTGSGSINISSFADVISTALSQTGSGSISFGGSARLSYLGDLRMADMGMRTLLSYVEAIFGESQGEELSINDPDVNAGCNCDPLPLAIRIRHNINTNNDLESFLFRNSFIMNRNDTILYKKNTNSWNKTYHFRGDGEITGSTENWLINIEFGCVGEIQNASLGQNLWKFCFFARRTIMDTGDDYDTRVLFVVPPESICERTPSKTLEMNFVYDTQLNLNISDFQVDVIVFNDEIGLFKGKRWIDDPNLEILVTEGTLPSTSQTLNLSPIFPTIPNVVREI